MPGSFAKVRKDFTESKEINTAGDLFFLVFAKPSVAVKFSILLHGHLRALAEETGCPVFDRIGIHTAEVFSAETQEGAATKDLYGLQVDTCAREMSLGQANQILMTRFPIGNERQVVPAADIQSSMEFRELQWLDHGPYLLKGLEDPIEICEVRLDSDGPFDRFASDE